MMHQRHGSPTRTIARIGVNNAPNYPISTNYYSGRDSSIKRKGSWSVMGSIRSAINKVRSGSFKHNDRQIVYPGPGQNGTPNPGGGSGNPVARMNSSAGDLCHSGKEIRRQKSAYGSTSHRDHGKNKVKDDFDDNVRKMVTHNDQKLHALQALKSKRLLGDSGNSTGSNNEEDNDSENSQNKYSKNYKQNKKELKRSQTSAAALKGKVHAKCSDDGIYGDENEDEDSTPRRRFNLASTGDNSGSILDKYIANARKTAWVTGRDRLRNAKSLPGYSIDKADEKSINESIEDISEGNYTESDDSKSTSGTDESAAYSDSSGWSSNNSENDDESEDDDSASEAESGDTQIEVDSSENELSSEDEPGKNKAYSRNKLKSIKKENTTPKAKLNNNNNVNSNASTLTANSLSNKSKTASKVNTLCHSFDKHNNLNNNNEKLDAQIIASSAKADDSHQKSKSNNTDKTPNKKSKTKKSKLKIRSGSDFDSSDSEDDYNDDNRSQSSASDLEVVEAEPDMGSGITHEEYREECLIKPELETIVEESGEESNAQTPAVKNKKGSLRKKRSGSNTHEAIDDPSRDMFAAKFQTATTNKATYLNSAGSIYQGIPTDSIQQARQRLNSQLGQCRKQPIMLPKIDQGGAYAQTVLAKKASLDKKPSVEKRISFEENTNTAANVNTNSHTRTVVPSNNTQQQINNNPSGLQTTPSWLASPTPQVTQQQQQQQQQTQQFYNHHQQQAYQQQAYEQQGNQHIQHELQQQQLQPQYQQNGGNMYGTYVDNNGYEMPVQYQNQQQIQYQNYQDQQNLYNQQQANLYQQNQQSDGYPMHDENADMYIQPDVNEMQANNYGEMANNGYSNENEPVYCQNSNDELEEIDPNMIVSETVHDDGRTVVQVISVEETTTVTRRKKKKDKLNKVDQFTPINEDEEIAVAPPRAKTSKKKGKKKNSKKKNQTPFEEDIPEMQHEEPTMYQEDYIEQQHQYNHDNNIAMYDDENNYINNNEYNEYNDETSLDQPAVHPTKPKKGSKKKKKDREEKKRQKLTELIGEEAANRVLAEDADVIVVENSTGRREYIGDEMMQEQPRNIEYTNSQGDSSAYMSDQLASPPCESQSSGFVSSSQYATNINSYHNNSTNSEIELENTACSRFIPTTGGQEAQSSGKKGKSGKKKNSKKSKLNKEDSGNLSMSTDTTGYSDDMGSYKPTVTKSSKKGKNKFGGDQMMSNHHRNLSLESSSGISTLNSDNISPNLTPERRNSFCEYVDNDDSAHDTDYSIGKKKKKSSKKDKKQKAQHYEVQNYDDESSYNQDCSTQQVSALDSVNAILNAKKKSKREKKRTNNLVQVR